MRKYDVFFHSISIRASSSVCNNHSLLNTDLTCYLFITSTEDVMLCHSVSVRLQDSSPQSYQGILMKLIFVTVGCVTSNSWLDFADGSDLDADTGICKRNFYHCSFSNFADNSRSCRRRIIMKFLYGWNVSLPKDFHLWCLGFVCTHFNGIFTIGW